MFLRKFNRANYCGLLNYKLIMQMKPKVRFHKVIASGFHSRIQASFPLEHEMCGESSVIIEK